jgi:hypothetical protein
MSVFDYCNDILLGALKLAQADLDRGRLDAERIADISHCVDEIIEDLTELEEADAAREQRKPDAAEATAPTNIVRLSGREHGRTVVVLPGRGKLARDGFKAAVPEQSTPSLADFGNAAAICVCQVSPTNESLMRYTVRRVRRSAASQPLILAVLGKHPASAAASVSEKTVTSLEALIDALHAIKSDGIKPQAKTD